MRDRLSLWLAPTADDPDLARRQYLLNLVLLGLAGPGLLFGLISTALWMATRMPTSLVGALGGVGVQLFYLLAYWLGQRGQVRLAGYIPVVVLFVLMIGTSCRFGVGHAMLVGYAIVVLTAGTLVSIGVALSFAGLCTVAHVVVGSVQTAGGLPFTVPPSATALGDGVAIGMGLIVIVVFNRLAIREINRALHREQAVSAELRVYQAELEQRVTARTAELSKVNQQLVTEIAERRRSEALLALRNRELTTLYEAVTAINSDLSLEVVLQTVAEQMSRALSSERCTLSLWDREHSRVEVLRDYRTRSDRTKPPGAIYDLSDYHVTRRVLETGQPVVIHTDDRATERAEFALMKEQGASSLLMFPWIARDQVVGLVELLDSAEGRDYTPEEIRLAQSLAAQAAVAVENARLHAETDRRLRDQTVLREAGAIIASTLDPKAVLNRITEQMGRAVDATSAYISSYEPESTMATVLAEYVGPQACAQEQVSDLGVAYPEDAEIEWLELMQSGQYDISHIEEPDLTEFERAHMERYGVKTVLYIPLRVRDQLIGYVELWESRQRREFTPEEIALCQDMARQAAIALENARLYEQAQQQITEREQAEQALEAERASLARRVAERTAELSAANVELTKALRARDEFLATMSHELRTPLNAILGLSEALQEEVYGPLNERQRKSLGTIEKGGRALLELINDILDMARIGAGKLELVISPVSVEPVCEASLQAVREAAQERRLKITATYDSVVEVVQADRQRLKQILVNLLNNAVKFTPEGGEIGLEVVGDREQEVAHFTVWDTGIGISQEGMARLFQPFVQLDSSLSRRYEGTGLGLALVCHLTEMHGGGVSVESEVGKGSHFTVSLPWQRADERRGTKDESREAFEKGLQSAVEARESSAVVLLAEDNESNLQTISGYLEAKGYRIVVARDGVEAIERAREERPDVILMDIQMPGMDGLEATQRLRADADPSTGLRTDLADVPIVALTALAMPGDRERCLEAGVNEYLSKPVSLKKLVNVIEAQLRTTTEV